ncbi:MAG: hypothetical protein AVDCRST_MAG07-2029, partial [uncultured Frankineae bacterium]
ADEHHSARRAEQGQPVGRHDRGLRAGLRARRGHDGTGPRGRRGAPARPAGPGARRRGLPARRGDGPRPRTVARRPPAGRRAVARALPRVGLRRRLRLPARPGRRHDRSQRLDLRRARAGAADAVPGCRPPARSGVRRRPRPARTGAAPGAHLGAAARGGRRPGRSRSDRVARDRCRPGRRRSRAAGRRRPV